MRFLPVIAILAAANLQAAGNLTVVSAATFLPGPLAPESIATAFGSDLATSLPGDPPDAQVTVADSAGATRSATLFYVSPGQVNFEIPPGTAIGSATVTITSGDGAVSQTTVNIAAVSPGFFAGGMELVVTAPDGTQSVTPATHPCGEFSCQSILNLGPPGSQTALAIFGTGIRGRSSLANVTCTVGALPVTVLYAGPAPGFTGVDQVNIDLPLSLPTGYLPIAVTVDSQPANLVGVSIVGLPPLARATFIVSQLTLDEKIQELHGIQDANDYRTVPGVPRLGIPALNITNGPAGVTNGGPGHQGAATALPAPISLAATWDQSLAILYGFVIGTEAKALANGFVEGPDINIARVPQNGRTFEAFGEDPFLVGTMAANEIHGIQRLGVIAEAKHFAGNNQETNRTTINDIIDERTLREIYLPAFEASVKYGGAGAEPGAGAVMCAYNLVNGVYNCENDLLMNQILKGEWGFSGFITSDFGAVHSTVPSALAGLDLEMPTGINFDSALKSAVNAGQVPMPVIDDKLIRRFTTMMNFGIFDQPPTNQPLPTNDDGEFAFQIAVQGMVLLKNDGNVLPLDANNFHSLAVIGPYATKAMTGGGGSSQVVPAFTVDPVPGIQNLVGSALSIKLDDGSNVARAASLAQSSDVAIVMVGDSETEGSDHSLALSGNQDQLVQAVAAANPNTVVVIKSGSPVLMPWVNQVPAILEAWYPGERDGDAVANVLFGYVNPIGKLPMTFPVKVSDLPANTPAQYPGINNVADYSEGVFVGYRYFDANDIQPLFPFGHGLSYTTFSYSNLSIYVVESTALIEFDVTNTGSVPGSEITQGYVGMPTAAVPQPPKQLKAFRKVSLNPNQTGHVTLYMDQRAFSYWDVSTHSWLIAPGNYQIMIGSSSRDIRLQSQVTLP